MHAVSMTTFRTFEQHSGQHWMPRKIVWVLHMEGDEGIGGEKEREV